MLTIIGRLWVLIFLPFTLSKGFMVIMYHSNNARANNLVKLSFSNFVMLRRNYCLLLNIMFRLPPTLLHSMPVKQKPVNSGVVKSIAGSNRCYYPGPQPHLHPDHLQPTNFQTSGGPIERRHQVSVFLSFLKILYLFIFRGRGAEEEGEGEKHRCVRETSISCLSHTPNWGPGPQPRHVP